MLLSKNMANVSGRPGKEILEAALQGLEAQRQRLDEQTSQVRSMMGTRVGRPPGKKAAASNQSAAQPATKKRAAGKRTLSAEARKRIAAAQKKRWAAFRKTQS